MAVPVRILSELCTTSSSGLTVIIDTFLSRGALVDAKDPSGGYTALHYAAAMGPIATVALLLDQRAVVDMRSARGSTALSVAAGKEQEDIVRLLLGKGADNNAQDGLAETALHKASESGYRSKVELLIETGANT